MEEDPEYQKLPVEDRVVHKLWKARVHGYEELTKLFRQIDDDKSSEFSKYLGVVKKFVTDSNAMGQEKGLEATLAFVENYAHADRTAGEVMSGIVSKCLSAPKQKTRDLAVQLILMYIEIEKYETVQDELIKGMENKNPKTVAACVNVTTLALREFGPKVISVKKLLKKMPALLADRDKNVRDETKAMVVEIYRWIGPALKSQLATLQPIQVTELEVEFAKVNTKTPIPSRYLRSQQQRQAKLPVELTDGDEGDGDEVNDAPPDVDPYELLDPVNILAKLPSDFYDKVEAKKWQERKEAVEALEELVKSPKLENGDYGELVRALKKIICKDSNVVVIVIAVKCLTGLATGLKKRFQAYAGACIPALLEKFREKKQNVVIALREALDAVFPSTNIEAILEDVLEALNNKNPSVKAETVAFLARAFTKCHPTNLNKKVLKTYTGAILKTLNEPDSTVRDNSAEALGTLMKLVGEKTIAPFLTDVDNLKMTKIKECFEKAVITVKAAGVKKERPNTAPTKHATEAPPAPKSVKRPSSAAPTKKKPVHAAAAKSAKAKSVKVATEMEMSAEEIEERALQFFEADILSTLADSNWKVRLESVQKYQEKVKTMTPGSAPAQVLVGVLNMKPGFKDTNVLVLKLKLETLKMIAEIHNISTVSAKSCINEVTDKLGDPKNSTLASDALSAMAEATSLDYVVTTVLDYAFSQKSPKVQQESLLFVSNAIKEFGFSVNPKNLTENVKKGVAAIQPTVRSAGIILLGTLYLYMGNALLALFDNEKPALKSQIMAECEKHTDEKPPDPIRGLSRKKCASTDYLDEIEEEGESEPTFTLQDLVPRVDISGQITDALLAELSDKNWKIKNEALNKLNTIINEAKCIQPNIGDLTQVLASRLSDSNAKVAQTALLTCQAIATAMGPPCKLYIRLLFPGFLSGLSDNKAWIRSSSITCINTWGDICGYKEFFDGEMIADALKSGSPNLRTELWIWLADKLGNIPLKSVSREELLSCVPILYTNLEDRNADIRKNVQEAVLPFMIHLGYETMLKQTEKLKPGSKSVVMEVLEKTRPNLPMKPLPPNKQQASIDKRSSVAPKSVKPGSGSKAPAKVRASVAGGGKPATARKKEDDIDLSPLLVVNNLKHQRVIDEQKLRVLKWNFTQPRPEFFELLKEQMITAKVNKNLIANMFHADFRYHLKALECLTEDLESNGPALISNLDLILKWLSLRFFDTNPSVLLKGLEYLQIVFNMLIDKEHRLLENEASSFIPYLILKVGDPKDAVRNGVRALFNQIAMIYPVNKLFSYIMEGLKSKNARQRTECLEELGALIGNYGTSVCQPTPAAAMKEVAKQISDRDNSVRNSALNCIVQAYHIIGEKIYKMVGQISDKDLSLLEERIKRAPKKDSSRQSGSRNSVLSPASQQNAVAPTNTSPVPDMDQDLDNSDEREDMPVPSPPPELPTRRPAPQPAAVNGPFFLDPEVLKQIEGSPVVIRRGPPPMDWTMFDTIVNDPIKFPENYKGPRQFDIPAPMPLSSMSRPTTAGAQLGHELGIATVCSNLSSSDLKMLYAAIEEVDKLLHNPTRLPLMKEYEDLFMINITTQLVSMSQIPLEENLDILRKYRYLLTLISGFYDNTVLGSNLSKDAIKRIIEQLIYLLVKFDTIEEKTQYIRVLNSQCLEIIEKSNHTKLTCALITLLHESVGAKSPARIVDLIMKCLWRVIKFLPDWADDLDYDAIIYDIYMFFKDYPSAYWKQQTSTDQASDYPIRTVKTVLHTMAKIKGKHLMTVLNKIPNANESELQPYMYKLLKSLKLEEVKKIPLKKETVKRPLSRTMQKMLADIFEKIGMKQTTKEGLQLLYDFRLQHPEADIQPFLEKSSQFFQEYIQNGLKEIEVARNSDAAGTGKSFAAASGDASCPTGTLVSCDNDYGDTYSLHRLTDNTSCNRADAKDGAVDKYGVVLNEVQNRIHQ